MMVMMMVMVFQKLGPFGSRPLLPVTLRGHRRRARYADLLLTYTVPPRGLRSLATLLAARRTVRLAGRLILSGTAASTG